ncbi:hypothetical protein LMG28140_03300 [Paraburkholderia metrosideri]|uniref:Transposon Tn7 transposition protein TnsD C-termianl domain-containing protein n=1 Tax=Paraburkholderia metrosideri TaxID=580937 RepID=A0ABN7HUS5_9BURK|nr:hypothetical protein LMG28140_03300 [Paraburkholderia metrosideri]
MSNVDNHRGVMEILGRPSHRPAFIHPANVEGISKLFPGLLPDWETIVLNHTRYRLNSAFLPRQNRTKLLRQYRSGTARGTHSYLATHQQTLRGRLGICLSCMETDLKVRGFPVWHRIHLTPSMLYCPTHEEPLMSYCRDCDISHRRAPKTWHPQEVCLCGGPLRRVGVVTKRNSVEAAIAISRMAEDVLMGRIDTSTLSENTGPVLRAKVRRIAEILERRDYQQVAREHLEGRLGNQLALALGFKALTFERATGHHRESAGPLRNPIQNIASVWALFGGWTDFFIEVKRRRTNPRRYDATATTPPKRIRPRRDSKHERWQRQFDLMNVAELSRYRRKCRSEISGAMRLNPSYKRSDIRYLADGQRLTFFATRYDARWLDKNLPSQAGKPSLPKVIERKRAQDEMKRKLVRERYAVALRENPERLISRAFLLSETGNESAYKLGTGTPELEAVLDQCVDTHDSWRERQIKLITDRARTVGKKSKWAERTNFEGCHPRQFSDRLRRAKAWIERNSE